MCDNAQCVIHFSWREAPAAETIEAWSVTYRIDFRRGLPAPPAGALTVARMPDPMHHPATVWGA